MSSERQLLNPKDPWWGEHVHRYNEVLRYVSKQDIILDIACGTGFGSDILAQHTMNKVIGGDIAVEAVEACKTAWNRSNLYFEVLDGTNLRYDEATFDKIVSFETIEHTTAYMQMLKEFYRVLKPGGYAFISTPNFVINSPKGVIVNPYHTQEFTFEELFSLLAPLFKNVEIKGQKYSRYDTGKRNLVGKVINYFFSIKGIRKLPYSFKNKASYFFTRKPFYPTETDYTMVADKKSILKCKTFFCICRK